MNVFSRSWYITKLSFGVIGKDKEMIAFPLLGGIFSLAFMFAMIFPSIVVGMMKQAEPTWGALDLLILFVTYVGIAFIAAFFNTCVVYTAKTRFEGGDATFMDSIRFAFSRIHLIFMWSLVAATVGLLLRLLENAARRAGGIGAIIMTIITRLIGMAWAIVTMFVIPVMVYDNLGPFPAIKQSFYTLRQTWGESLIKYLGLGFVQGIFTVLGVIVGVMLTVLLSFIGLGIVGILIGISLTVIYLVLVTLLFNVANQVYNTALFVYAKTGNVPAGFDDQSLRNAFQPQMR